MDHATLQTLARIKIRLRQEKGIVLNTQRFFTDPRYAVQVLDAAEESEDIELVTASLDIRNQLGWIDINTNLSQPPATPGNGAAKQPQAGASSSASVASGRYVFGARS